MTNTYCGDHNLAASESQARQPRKVVGCCVSTLGGNLRNKSHFREAEGQLQIVLSTIVVICPAH